MRNDICDSRAGNASTNAKNEAEIIGNYYGKSKRKSLLLIPAIFLY